MATVVAPRASIRDRFGLWATRTVVAARATPSITKAHDPESIRAAFMSTRTANAIPLMAMAARATLPMALVAQCGICPVEAVITCDVGIEMRIPEGSADPFSRTLRLRRRHDFRGEEAGPQPVAEVSSTSPPPAEENRVKLAVAPPLMAKKRS